MGEKPSQKEIAGNFIPPDCGMKYLESLSIIGSGLICFFLSFAFKLF